MSSLGVGLVCPCRWRVSVRTLSAGFDDGNKTINVETTVTDKGGYALPTDEELLIARKLPTTAQTCGSDLRPLTPREMLGTFFGSRDRHLQDISHYVESERDFLAARYLFPCNRMLYIGQTQISVQVSMGLFEPGETGHPIELAEWLQNLFALPRGLSSARTRPHPRALVALTNTSENLSPAEK